MTCECGHSIDQHCAGEKEHADHKEEARMVPLKWRSGAVTCHTIHCLQPLCCCVNFKEKVSHETA